MAGRDDAVIAPAARRRRFLDIIMSAREATQQL